MRGPFRDVRTPPPLPAKAADGATGPASPGTLVLASRDWRVRVVVAGLLAVALVAAVARRRASTEQAATGLRTVEVRSGTLARTVLVTGSTAAAEGVMLRAPYLRGNRSRGGSGDFQLELTQLAEPGRHVRQGEIVAVFDNESMRNRLDNVEAEVAEAESVVKRLQADQAAQFDAHEQKLRVARADLDRAVLDLKTVRVRSALQAQAFALALEEAQATLQALTAETPHLRARQAAELRSAQLEAERATVEARRAQANLDRLTVRAPMDGLVVSQEIYRGGQFGQVRQGDQLHSGQPYVRIADLRRMVVEAAANQVDATELRTGQSVRVHFDAYPGLELPGRVEGVGAMARNTGPRAGYVAEIPLVIALGRTDPRALPGLSVSGEVQVASVDNLPIVPREAVFYDPGDTRPNAYVRTPAGWEKRGLDLELSDNFEAAVHAGVVEGEFVALDRPAEWRAGRSAPTTSVRPRGRAVPGG